VSELSSGFDTSTGISSGSQSSAISWTGMFTHSISHFNEYTGRLRKNNWTRKGDIYIAED